MSTLKVANVHFKTDGSVRIALTSNNVIRAVSNAGLQIPGGTLVDRPPQEGGIIRYNTENFNNEIGTLNTFAIIATNNDITPAFLQANTAGSTAISAFGQANNVTAAFLQANTAGSTAISAFNQANNVTAAFLKANTAGTDATNAFAQANVANTLPVGNTLSNNMFQVRSSGRTRLNFIPGTSITINVDDDSSQDRANVTITAPDVVAAFNQANNVTAAFNQANNVTAAFLKANTAGTDATNAFGQANNVTAAFLQANTAGSTAISAFGKANVANTLSVGNTLSNNMFQLRSTSRTRLNLIPGTSITINVDDDSAQDRANVTITAPDVVAAFAQANNVTAAFLKANTAGTDANSAFSKANTSVQNNATTFINTGYTVASFNAASNLAAFGTWTPDPANGNYQWANTNGALTIAVPASNCAIEILIINGPTTGAITFSGYTVSASTGDTYASTAVNKYILTIRKINTWSTYVWKALQ